MKRFPSILYGILLCAALLVPIYACVPAEAPGGGGLIVTEVMSVNHHSVYHERYGTPDWIELYNDSDEAITLSDYLLSDDLTDRSKAVPLMDGVLQPHCYCLVYADRSAAYTEGESAVDFALSGKGETLVLLDEYYNLIFELSLPALDADVSYALRTDGSYGYCADPTPEAANDTPIYDSLAAAQAAIADKRITDCRILFNEVCSVPSSRSACPSCGKETDFVELYNPTDTAYPLDGLLLSDKPTARTGCALDGYSVPAYGYLTVFCCDCGGANTVQLGLSKAGETLYLLSDASTVLLSLDFPAATEGCSYARTENGDYGCSLCPTPNEKNSCILPVGGLTRSSRSEAVCINEVLADNRFSITDRYGEHSDYVELFNPTNETLSLKGLYLSDDASALTKWALPAEDLAAGAYCLVFLSGRDTAEGEWHANFSLSEGETLYLTDIQAGTQDCITILKTQGAALGLDETGNAIAFLWPTPNGDNGFSFDPLTAEQPCFDAAGVFISEVYAAHGVGEDKNDWVELYNGGDETVSLQAWTFSDNVDEPQKWSVCIDALAAGETALIENDSLTLSKNGERLYLFNEKGCLMDSFQTGVLSAGLSCGRLTNEPTIERVFFPTPTKGRANVGTYMMGYTPQPTFSDRTLYHREAFSLSIFCSDQSAVIRYTLDGSVPGETSPVYTGAIRISGSCTVRAAAFSAGRLSASDVCATYLFVEQHSLPVVCLTLDANEFSKVYAAKEREQIYETACCVDYYEADGSLGISFRCGVRAKGRGSLTYPQKSLTLKLRGSYGQKSVYYPFLGEGSALEYQALALRSGGQDIDNAVFRDSLIAVAAKDLLVDTEQTNYVVLYVNGAYFGLFALDDEMNADYFAAHYGIDTDDMEVINQNRTAKTGTADAFVSLIERVSKLDCSTAEGFAVLESELDVDAFTDYIVIQTLTGNTDTLNQKYARSLDGTLKWRPVLFDLDYAYAYRDYDALSAYFLKDGFRPSENSSLVINNVLYRALFQNANWRERFVRRFIEAAYGDFDTKRLNDLADELAEILRPEMERQIARWGMHDSVADWEKEVETLKSVITARRETAFRQLKHVFGLSDEAFAALVKEIAGQG